VILENWLTRLELLFEDPAFERRWREDNYKRSLVQVRVATAIAVVIYGAYGFVDPIILPPEATDTNLWPHRLSGSVIIALVCISSFTSWFERFWQWLLFGGVMSVVVGLTWMWLDLGLSVYWYYHNGLVLILVFSVLLLRLTFRTTVLLVSTTFVLFVVTAFVLRPAPDINVVATSSLAFVSLIGLFAAGHLEANERKVYWQNTLIESQRSNLQESLDDLEAAQTQLIQAEKMASLGHLSAGIAHEIRNPLNFVSNFAAVSTEVLEDLEAELKNKKVAPEENQVIAESLEQLRDGSVHIQTHAARADQIVQRLIEHSDRSGGARTQANLNDVVSAGIEAAASRFVTKTRLELPELRVQYYESGIEVEMVRREIGKVVDNLVDNALYSVYAKQKIDERFQGRVDVKTDLVDGSASVRVSDNGMGIPPESRKRIFEPFYTTRPTGEGTGLGLFLCYQIIASHFGDIEVESRDGQWANVMVTLPAARGKLTDDT
jgi:signal transduction histidine kinase